eukprot:gene9746-20269_t
MLTRKQCWRKTKTKVVSTSQLAHRAEREFERTHVGQNTKEINGFADIKYSAVCSSHDDICLLDIPQTRNVGKKCLRFSSTVYVLLIPSRQEISAYSSNLYWSDGNYSSFKKEAVDEIRAVIQSKKCTAKEAIQLLYQPQHEDQGLTSKQSIEIEVGRKSIPGTSKEDEHIKEEQMVKLESNQEELSGEVISFIGAVKTDVELNKEMFKAEEDEEKERDADRAPSHQSSQSQSILPHRTPSRAAAPNPNMWAVQWRKGAETVRNRAIVVDVLWLRLRAHDEFGFEAI